MNQKSHDLNCKQVKKKKLKAKNRGESIMANIIVEK